MSRLSVFEDDIAFVAPAAGPTQTNRRPLALLQGTDPVKENVSTPRKPRIEKKGAERVGRGQLQQKTLEVTQKQTLQLKSVPATSGFSALAIRETDHTPCDGASATGGESAFAVSAKENVLPDAAVAAKCIDEISGLSPASTVSLPRSPWTVPLSSKQRKELPECPVIRRAPSAEKVPSTPDTGNMVQNTPSDIFCMAAEQLMSPGEDSLMLRTQDLPPTPETCRNMPATPSTVGEANDSLSLLHSSRLSDEPSSFVADATPYRSNVPTIPESWSSLGMYQDFSHYMPGSCNRGTAAAGSLGTVCGSGYSETRGFDNAVRSEVQLSQPPRGTPAVRRLNLESALELASNPSSRRVTSPATVAAPRSSGSVLRLSQHLPTPPTAPISLSRALGIDDDSDLKPRNLFAQ